MSSETSLKNDKVVAPPIPGEIGPSNLFGPTNLDSALEVAEPSIGGIKVAVTSPTARFIAIQLADGKVFIRAVNDITGRCGSEMGTGEWLELTEETKHIKGHLWRPA